MGALYQGYLLSIVIKERNCKPGEDNLTYDLISKTILYAQQQKHKIGQWHFGGGKKLFWRLNSIGHEKIKCRSWGIVSHP
jgi:hypothetical protein